MSVGFRRGAWGYKGYKDLIPARTLTETADVVRGDIHYSTRILLALSKGELSCTLWCIAHLFLDAVIVPYSEYPNLG